MSSEENISLQSASNKIPHKWVFYIQSEFPNYGISKYGTGWLLNPRTIITAAHVLTHFQQLADGLDLIIAPHSYLSSPLNGGDLFVSFGRNVVIPGTWQQKNYIGSDYAAIILESNQEIHGEGNFSVKEVNSFSDAYIAGYIHQNKNNINSSSCYFIHKDPNFFQYNSNAYPGHSGAPLYIKHNSDFQVIGTHKGIIGGLGYASLIDNDFISFISNL